MKRIVEVLDDKSALIARSLALTVEKIEEAVRGRDRCAIALAGGSTPKPLYEALATQSLPWEKIHIFWGDERYVPPSSPESNEGMARQAWLDRVPLPPENIHPMPTAAADPAADAATHNAQLRDFFKTPPGEFPEFDLILLGMGDDGHTASLFPQTEVLSVRDRLVAVGNKDGQPRLTFTLPLINRARCVLFLVAGASKQPALAQIFAETADERDYPSRSIQPAGELYWLLDRAAGDAIGEKVG